jgi:hypothetical protein
VKEWIRSILDPPGMERGNAGALFSFIGRVFGIVKEDAVKAHNAHFPYLADMEKLRQHARALMIPELENDTEKLFRDRAAAASFYLSKAGERGFILNELESRFGNRFEVVEKFLQLRVKLIGMSEKERRWMSGLLDSLIDPNVYFELTEWLRCRERVRFKDGLPSKRINIKPARDVFPTHEARDALRFLGLRNAPFKDFFFTALKYDGKFKHDGKYKADASRDKVKAKIKPAGFKDAVTAKDSLHAGIRYWHYHDGRHKADGSIKFNSGILIPLREGTG